MKKSSSSPSAINLYGENYEKVHHRPNNATSRHAESRAKRVQLLLVIAGVILLRLLASAFQNRPKMSSFVFLWSFGILFFLSTDTSGKLHASQKTENKFWMAMASSLCTILFFVADDSPLCVSHDVNGFMTGVGWNIVVTYATHIIHKRSHRQTLENRSAIPKNKSYRDAISDLAQQGVSMEGLVAEVNEAVAALESLLIPGGFRRLVGKISLRVQERKVIEIFRDCSRAQLNYLVLHVNMNVVFYRLKNHYKPIYKLERAATTSATTSATTTPRSAIDRKPRRRRRASSSTDQTGGLGVDDAVTPILDMPDSRSVSPLNYEELPVVYNVGSSIPNVLREPTRIDDDAEYDSDDALEFVLEDELVKTETQYEDTFESDMERTDHRNALVQLLAAERLADLTTSARASVLDAIQVVGMMRNPHTKDRAQGWAASIILNSRGDQLSELKTITDAKGSVHSMHKLVYNDITDSAIRASLLSHFQTNKRSKLGRKVLSDVDDTFLCSGGRYPAGIDETYPRHVIYPGAGAFYEGLDRGTSALKSTIDSQYGSYTMNGSNISFGSSSGNTSSMNSLPRSRESYSGFGLPDEDDFVFGSETEDESPSKKKKTNKPARVVVGNLVFLSARPHVYKDMAEKRVYSKFERFIHARNLHAMPTLLPGDLESGQSYMLRGDFEPMARKKLKNMVEYHSIYPEFSHVFIGDNGQADVRAAELMKERLGATLEGVYIHQVQPLDRTFGYTETSYKKWNEMGIVFYKTFVGAAADACDRGLIDPSSLREVCLSASREFSTMFSKSSMADKFPGSLLGIEARRIELETDFERANACLTVRGYAIVPPPRALCMYPVGSTVYTQFFGEGFVRLFRPMDGIYHVVFLNGSLSGYFTARDLRATRWHRSARGHFPGSLTFALGDGRPITGNSIQAGTKVSTPYGEGTVRRWRPSDSMYEVTMTKWSALAVLRGEDVELFVNNKRASRIWGYGKDLIKRTFSRNLTASPQQNSLVQGAMIGVQLAESMELSPVFEPGSRVLVAPFGQAVVACHRASDGIVAVRFDSLKADGFVNVASVKLIDVVNVTSKKSPNLTSYSSVSSRMMSAIGFNSSGGNSSSSISSPSSSMGGLLNEYPVLVGTPYGKGTIVSAPERADGIVRVSLAWGADAYMNRAALVLMEKIPAGVTSRILSLLVANSPRLVRTTSPMVASPGGGVDQSRFFASPNPPAEMRKKYSSEGMGGG